jgi:hypothetical protein
MLDFQFIILGAIVLGGGTAYIYRKNGRTEKEAIGRGLATAATIIIVGLLLNWIG